MNRLHSSLKELDPEIYAAVENEERRQSTGLELIAERRLIVDHCCRRPSGPPVLRPCKPDPGCARGVDVALRRVLRYGATGCPVQIRPNRVDTVFALRSVGPTRDVDERGPLTSE